MVTCKFGDYHSARKYKIFQFPRSDEVKGWQSENMGIFCLKNFMGISIFEEYVSKKSLISPK